MRLGSVQEFLKERELQRTDWRRKPLPKKVLIVATLPLFAAGVVLLQVVSSLTSMALGAAMIGASLLLLWLGS
jgi:protein-S-isoprenylcysteine O-methyltransferase Ste14